jgi:hypothetical protein
MGAAARATMTPMLKQIFKKLVPSAPSEPEPDPDVITAMIGPEPGAILGKSWKSRP